MKTIKERIEGKYRVAESGCWEWTASYNGAGYGQIHVDGSPTNASRASYLAHKGTIPKGMDVCHTCDNRGCINPAHLFLGTRKENIQDAAKKGRLPRGDKRPNSKLDATEVLLIRGLSNAGVAQRTIASEFGVACSVVHHIIHRRTWAHVA